MTDYTKEEKSVVKSKEFDFDYWCKLAKENPDVFETVRKQEIENEDRFLYAAMRHYQNQVAV